MKKNLAALILLASAQTAAAAYIRFLIPVYIPQPVPGAYGSVWQSSLAIHNGSAVRSYIIEACADGCPAILPADEELVPNETQTGLPARYPAPVNGVAGTVLYVLPEPASGDQPGAPADDATSLSFESRVTDLSSSMTTAGTEIPVVRESAFRTSTIHLLDVPLGGPPFRLALRILEMNVDRADFAVRVYSQTLGYILRGEKLTTVAPPQTGLRFTPGFAESTDFTQFVIGPPFSGGLRVEVEPLTPGAAFWAYISITNNESQLITLITPQ